MSLVVVSITTQDVRASIAVARSHGEKFFEQVVWQIENMAWKVLGYDSWDAMRDAEYGDMGVIAPRADRPELAARLRSRGLTQKQIGDTLGVSQRQISTDLNSKTSIENAPESITNSRGQERPASYAPRAEPEPYWSPDESFVGADPLTGEVIEPTTITETHTVKTVTGLDGKTYTPKPPTERRSSILTDARNAGWQLRKAVERLERIRQDDRYQKNKAEILAAVQPHLDFANEVFSDL